MRAVALLIVMLISPVAFGSSVWTPYYSTSQDSGDYLDFWTNVHYQWNNATKVLLPQGLAPSVAPYVIADAFVFGQSPNPATGFTNTCQETFCGAGSLAAAYADSVVWQTIVVLDCGDTYGETTTFGSPFPVGLHRVLSSGTDHCPGQFTVRWLVNDQIVATDSVFFS